MDFLTWQKKGGKGGMSPKRIKAVTKKDRRKIVTVGLVLGLGLGLGLGLVNGQIKYF